MWNAGAITGKLTLDTKPFDRSLGKARGMARRFRGGMAQMGGRIAKALFNPFTAALAGIASVAGVTALLKKTAGEMDRIAKVGSRLGITTEALTGLGFAAEQSGVETRTLEMGLQRMTRRVAEAAQGSGEAQAALAELGLSAQQLAAMSPDQQFLKIADAMQGVSSQSDKVRLGFKLFDSEGVSLIQTMNGGADAIRAQMQEMKKLNGTFNATDSTKVQEMNDALNKVKTVIKGALQKAVVALAPYIKAIADKFVNAAKEGEGFGKLVSWYIEGVAIRIASVADVLNLFEAGFHGLRATASLVIGGLIKGFAKLAQAAFKLLDNPVGQKIFGDASFERGRELNAGLERVGDAMLDVAEAAAGKAGQAWDDFATGKNARAVRRFFADAKADAQKVGEEAKKAGEKAGAAMAGIGKAAKQQMSEAEKAIADVARQVDQFGMTDAQKKIADFSELENVTGKQIAQYRMQVDKLQQLRQQADRKSAVADALESIESPMDKFRKALERFREWFKDGLINRSQLDKLTARLRSETFGDEKAPRLVRAGSAEAQLLRYQQGRAQASNRRDYDRQQVDQQKKTNSILDTIARLFGQRDDEPEVELVGI